MGARVRAAVGRLRADGALVSGLVAGPDEADAVEVAGGLAAQGYLVSVDRLVDDPVDRDAADATVASYLTVLRELADAGLADGADVSIRPSAIGAALPGGTQIVLDRARTIGDRAADLGATVTYDMQVPSTVEPTLALVHALREDHPDTGVTVQSRLYRTEADCRDLAGDGFRVRLCKGAYDTAADVGHQRVEEIDKAFVRCAKILLAGSGRPMLATHDTRLIEIAGSLAARFRREHGSYEYQVNYGVRPEEQRRLAQAGEPVRVWIPYGPDWSGYVARRVAARPSAALRTVAGSLAGRLRRRSGAEPEGPQR